MSLCETVIEKLKGSTSTDLMYRPQPYYIDVEVFGGPEGSATGNVSGEFAFLFTLVREKDADVTDLVASILDGKFKSVTDGRDGSIQQDTFKLEILPDLGQLHYVNTDCGFDATINFRAVVRDGHVILRLSPSSQSRFEGPIAVQRSVECVRIRSALTSIAAQDLYDVTDLHRISGIEALSGQSFKKIYPND